MTRSTRIYGKVALLMAGILAASVLLTLAVGVDRRPCLLYTSDAADE